jgi:microcystin-dependent protein
MMAEAAMYLVDIAGAIVTSGTSTAYTVSSYQVFDTLAHLDGAMVAFTPHAGNTDTNVTLNVDSLGAKHLRVAPNVEIQTGALIQGTPYVATYNNSDGAFYLQGTASYNTYSIPLGGALPYFGNATPNSAFALPYGQAISRTTYASLFSLLGTNYGSGDGSTTFNIPDLRGRVIAGFDDMGGTNANRLSAVMNSTTFNGRGGSSQITLGTANLPPYTPSGSVSVGTPGYANPQAFYGGVTQGGGALALLANNAGASSQGTVGSAVSGSVSAPSATFTGSAQGGSSSPVTTVQPTIVANYIMRII